MKLRLLLWIAMKNAIHPFHGLMSRHLQRRHARFDDQARVRTAGSVTLQELGLSSVHSVRYEATPIRFFHSVLGKLSLEYEKTVFIDLGCGKGRTLLLACHYPFRSIVGVEISDQLCKIANENINTHLSSRRLCPEISVVCKGIDEFEFDDFEKPEHLLIYMFNPCSGSVLEIAMHKLERLVSLGVPVTIIYLNPTSIKLLQKLVWLKETQRGETFDELGSSFMPYVVFRSLPPPWKELTEELVFQFGPWVFAKWRFASISNTTNPLDLQGVQRAIPPVLQPVTYQQRRADGTIPRAVSFDRGAIRYVPYRGKRYFVDLSGGSFDDYLAKFSSKTRNTLKRKVRRFANHSDGSINLRCYESPEEMIEFIQHAMAISIVSHQGKIGWGFPKTEKFKNNVIDKAAQGRVRGFVMMHEHRPVSFVFCRINGNIISYTIPGYDPGFVKFSPGTVLLYLILERLFTEGKFCVLDFGGHEWGYKALFGTGSVDYHKVIWFPISAKNLALVLMHSVLQLAWHGAAWVKKVNSSAKVLLENPLWPRSTIADEHMLESDEITDNRSLPRRTRRRPVNQ